MNTNLFTLKDKVAIVTGGGQNIGEMIALTLASFGAKVAIIDIDEVKAYRVKEKAQKDVLIADAFIADVTKPQQFEKVLLEIMDKWGTIDIAFNNVGNCIGGPAEDIPLEEWDAMLTSNLTATFNCCQQEARIMKTKSYGKIINTASIAGVLIPRPQKITAYNTAKAGVIHLTRSLAAEWAEYGIRVNSISPGIVHAPNFNTDQMKPWVDDWLSQIPLNKLATLDDLKGIAIYLASEASDYMTGQNMIIDGGHSLW